jgi:EAL domain-containing protein (putative c-di-GMP-specific phosphodiesterase class I)/FixJ family two-component response regulator
MSSHHPPMLRAVVIDGSASEREHTMAACQRAGLHVNGWADCGNAGLELIESLPAAPDLVIIDLRLPDMDGADLILALSMLERDVSIIICSDVDTRVQDAALTLAETLGMPALAALHKPLDPEALRIATLACVPAAQRAADRAVSSARSAAMFAPDADEILEAQTRHQFELHYQPKVALESHALQGAEALLRWRHPRHGLLSPGCFLPQAEAAGLVDTLTVTVLSLALRDWRGWQAAGLTLPLSINLSPLSLSDPHLAGQLIAAVADARVPPSAITFEITEHAEVSDVAVALRVLIKLRLHGFGLSLDDYGAGHASMLQLARIPFTELKLDRRLVHGASSRPHLPPLLRSAIAAARSMGVTTVAEGIEKAQDWRLLRALGCDLAQGYLVAKPMPAAELLAWRPSAASRFLR